MALSDIIIEKIQTNGPISFCDFMDMALYYPEEGYYTSGKERIGKNGDYLTSPALTPVFGAMIGKQLEEMWHVSGEGAFQIVEYGGGDGTLCLNILDYLKDNKPFFNKITYIIIEKNAALHELKRDQLPANVYFLTDASGLEPFEGCILSNELIDNFPVHLLVMQDLLQEVFVGFDEEFVELLKPASPELIDYLKEQGILLPKDYRTEINLKAIEWIEEIASLLERGFVLTIDYGYSATEFYSPKRYAGTLLCYNGHNISSDPYLHIGEQDITSHVNFSALDHFGAKNGLECGGFCGQANFLRSLGISSYIRQLEQQGKNNAELFRQNYSGFYTLLTGMGNKMKVFIQRKGVNGKQLASMQLFQERL